MSPATPNKSSAASTTACEVAYAETAPPPMPWLSRSVQRVHVPAPIDVMRSGGPFGAIEAVVGGYLRWVAGSAAAHPRETDLWLDPSPPHALRALRPAK